MGHMTLRRAVPTGVLTFTVVPTGHLARPAPATPEARVGLPGLLTSTQQGQLAMLPTRTASFRAKLMRLAKAVGVSALLIGGGFPARAGEAPPPPPTPPPPAPLGVFGADMPPASKLVVSIVPQFANLSGSRIGTRNLSSEEIVTTVPWFNSPTAKLRLVPQNVAVQTQAVTFHYGVTKDFSVFVALAVIERSLDMLTFSGPAGSTRLGMSSTGTAGLADLSASAIYRVYQDPIHRIQLNLGLAVPIGSNTRNFTLLTPDGTYQTSRAFYPLQPNSGTFDVMPGLVYAGKLEKWSWGLSYRGRFPLAANGQAHLEGDLVRGSAELLASGRPLNSQGYRYGDLHEFNGWGGYTWIPGLTTTFRVNASVIGSIHGFDPNIRGRAQAANPAFYGGQRVELFGGASFSGKFIGLDDMTVAIEAGAPVYQNLNGPQLMKNWQAGMALRWKL